MAGKPQQKAVAVEPGGGKVRDPNALEVTPRPDEDPAEAVARSTLCPTVRAACTIKAYSRVKFGELDLMGLVKELSVQSNAVHDDDLSQGEAMLTAQAHTLDSIFAELCRRAALNMGEYLNAAETYLRLALRAQSQCRATWETLATIKNPPTIFAKQANVTTGPQQVNNSILSRARETELTQDRLLEAQDGKRLDTRATGAAAGTNPAMATVGEVNGTKDARGKGEGQSKR
jgi:hypothetical protein